MLYALNTLGELTLPKKAITGSGAVGLSSKGLVELNPIDNHHIQAMSWIFTKLALRKLAK